MNISGPNGAAEEKKSARLSELIARNSDKVENILREQLFRDYLLGAGDGDRALGIYCRAFGVCRSLIARAALIRVEGHIEYGEMVFIRNFAVQCIGESRIICCTVEDGCVIIITAAPETEETEEKLSKIQELAEKCFGCETEAVYSARIKLCETASAYRRLRQCVGYAFYTGKKEKLRREDLTQDSPQPLKLSCAEVENAVKNGDAEKTELLINGFFDGLEEHMPAPAIAKTYCLELYVRIIRCCGADSIDGYMKGITKVQESRTLGEIKEYIAQKAREIAGANSPSGNKEYSVLVGETLKIIDENLGNEELSLRWLAGNILYTNVDYLGKLFKKEVGKNFSHYVMEKRMELAKRLILKERNDKIYEVAEKSGYGANSQYFSQVFKKYTGFSPIEYKEHAKTNYSGTANAEPESG